MKTFFLMGLHPVSGMGGNVGVVLEMSTLCIVRLADGQLSLTNEAQKNRALSFKLAH